MSVGRVHNVEVTLRTSASVSVQTTVITYPQKLLSLARRLIDEDEHAIAIIVVHMACEIATERTLSEAFAAKGVPYLEDPVTDLFSGNNLGNERIRKLYTALTGDQVEQAAFWQKFKQSSKLRNKIAHSSIAVSKQEAEDSLAAAKDLVAHLRK